MEMRYKMTGQLVMNLGDFSSVELELIVSITLVLQGIFGNEYLSSTVGESLGIAAGSKCPLHMVVDVYWRTILGCFFFIM